MERRKRPFSLSRFQPVLILAAILDFVIVYVFKIKTLITMSHILVIFILQSLGPVLVIAFS